MKRDRRILIAAGALIACLGIAVSANAAHPIGAYTTKGAYSFVSEPRLHPPKLHTDTATVANRLAPGYFMVANFYNLTSKSLMVGQAGPLILDQKLQPVWFRPVGEQVVANNLTTQTFDGKPALSWWQGVVTNTGAITSGEDIVVNQHYQTIATLKGSGGWIPALHEFLIRGHDAWVAANKVVPMPNGAIVDSAVQEYDLKTGQLLRTWDALGHIPLTDSYTHPAPGFPWDAYHINSISLTGGGKFLVSMRNTWAAYMVDSADNVDWTLGGKHSSFTLGSGAQFQWQHDVQLHPNGVVSVYDDACCAITGPGKFGPPTGPSRGLVLKLDTAKHTATLVAQYTRSRTFETAFLGSTQLLANGNVLVGWGSTRWFSEFSKAGKLLLDVRFPGPNLSYRTYLEPWVGLPLYPPIGAARNKHGKSTVYASWNGATRVVKWRLLAGPDTKHLTAVATQAKSGFETAIALNHTYREFRLEALDSGGHLIRASKAFAPGAHKPPTSGPPGYY